MGEHERKPLERPTIENSLLRDLMKRASKGKVNDLAALKVLLDHHTDSHHSQESIDEVRDALDWAEQEAWKRHHLKTSDHDLRWLMKDALDGGEHALQRLQGWSVSGRENAVEADVIYRFVTAKLSGME